jgi:hypothetical protein
MDLQPIEVGKKVCWATFANGLNSVRASNSWLLNILLFMLIFTEHVLLSW